MTKKIVILYDLQNKKPKEKTDVTRKLFGFQDKSNNSNYTYERKGLLYGFKYKKKNKVAIIIEPNDEKKIKKILKKFDLRCTVAEIKSG